MTAREPDDVGDVDEGIAALAASRGNDESIASALNNPDRVGGMREALGAVSGRATVEHHVVREHIDLGTIEGLRTVILRCSCGEAFQGSDHNPVRARQVAQSAFDRHF